jgi:hypothetical protein
MFWLVIFGLLAYIALMLFLGQFIGFNKGK